MSDLKTRLVQFAREQYNMGQNKFEEYCGISRGIINAIKDGGISTNTLTKIIVKCPELNIRWLLLGEENNEMILGINHTETKETEQKDAVATNILNATNGTINGDVYAVVWKELKEIIIDLKRDKERLLHEKEEIWMLYKKMIDEK